MKRTLILFALLALPALAAGQAPAPAAKNFPPDEATLKEIKAKTAELETAIAKLPKDERGECSTASVKVFHKAAVWIVRHGEWFEEKSAQKTLDVLKAGLARAKALSGGKTPWLDTRDKPIALGYQSGIDDSYQPFSLRYPDNFDPKKKYRMDIVLHGRNATLTEVGFLHGKEFAKAGKGTDYFVVEVYGRGNNAYRWAGERDVFEAKAAAMALAGDAVDKKQIVLRGFSMGGAGTWHIGLHYPSQFAVMSPGAGFTSTHGYIKGFPENPPDYIAKGLYIYDAVDYAENAFNIPIVAYSGGADPQKQAADNIENLLKKFKEPHSFTHIVAPDLPHKQPPEWFAKCDAEFRKILAKGKADRPERVRFVTYTLQYARCDWVYISALEEHYKRSLVDVAEGNDSLSIKTENVRSFVLTLESTDKDKKWIVEIDGQKFECESSLTWVELAKIDGKWKSGTPEPFDLRKNSHVHGPIDHAFSCEFAVVPPSKDPWNKELGDFAETNRKQFAHLWDKYFRGDVAKSNGEDSPEEEFKNIVYFGDPQSNPAIAKILPKLPIKWTKDELVVNGVKYDAKTHVPMLIYPKRFADPGYYIINSGHTFREADLKGTNALLYPHLGDWAVVKPKPTKEDPGAFEVVASGYFDEFWQFPKKK